MIPDDVQRIIGAANGLILDDLFALRHTGDLEIDHNWDVYMARAFRKDPMDGENGKSKVVSYVGQPGNQGGGVAERVRQHNNIEYREEQSQYFYELLHDDDDEFNIVEFLYLCKIRKRTFIHQAFVDLAETVFMVMLGTFRYPRSHNSKGMENLERYSIAMTEAIIGANVAVPIRVRLNVDRRNETVQRVERANS